MKIDDNEYQTKDYQKTDRSYTAERDSEDEEDKIDSGMDKSSNLKSHVQERVSQILSKNTNRMSLVMQASPPQKAKKDNKITEQEIEHIDEIIKQNEDDEDAGKNKSMEEFRAMFD